MTVPTETRTTRTGVHLVKGVWRNLYTNDLGWPGHHHEAPHECTILGDGTWLGRGRWPSREIAEQKAIESLEHNAAMGRPELYTWLGSIFLQDRDTKRLPPT